MDMFLGQLIVRNKNIDKDCFYYWYFSIVELWIRRKINLQAHFFFVSLLAFYVL